MRKFIITNLIGALLLFAGAAFFALLFSQIRVSREDIKKINEEIVSLEALQAESQNLERYLKDRQNDVGLVKSFFLRQEERPLVFIESLERLAKATNNKLVLSLGGGDKKSQGSDNSISLSGGKKPQEKDLFFALNIEGSEANARQFIKLLEFMPYYLKIERFSFQKSSAGSGGEERDAPANLQVFIRVKAI